MLLFSISQNEREVGFLSSFLFSFHSSGFVFCPEAKSVCFLAGCSDVFLLSFYHSILVWVIHEIMQKGLIKRNLYYSLTL